MRLLHSTTFRFAALVFVLQLAGAMALLATVHQLTRWQIVDGAEIQAKGLREQYLTDYRRGGMASLVATVADNAASGRFPGAVMLVVDQGGTSLAGNLGEWPPSLAADNRAVTTELYRLGPDVAERMRLIATPLSGGGRLLTGHVIENELRFATVLEEAMWSGLAVAVALAAFAAWSAARLIQRKLDATVHTAQAVAEGYLDQRVPIEGGGDAFDALGGAINAMLDRIAALMSELKIATDGLAHDLRSPLTRLRSTLERALEKSTDDESRIAVARAIEEGDRLLTVLDTALRITRAEAGLGRDSFVDTDIAAMVQDMVEMYGPVAEDAGFTIEADAPAGLRAPVHRELLGQALGNLIDNAMKYGAGHIRIVARGEADTLKISVIDDGPGIPEIQRAQALRRFGRLDVARSTDGAGLGLSLAAAVARLHGGGLELGDNAPGLFVVLTLDRTV